MALIKSKWRIISIVYLLASYLILIVFMHKPLSLYFINAAIFILLLILLFLGTFFGFLGLIIHMITKNEVTATPFYNLSYTFNTSNPTLLASYGLILLRKNESEKALQCFEKGYSVAKNYMTAKTLMSNIAISYWKLGRIDDSIAKYYEILTRFGPDDQEFFVDPDCFSDDSIETFTAANHIMYPQDHITLGFLHMLKKEYDKATFFTKAAMCKKANYASAYDNLGQIAYYQEDYTKAREHFEKALELSAQLPDSLYFMGLVNTQEENKKEALTFFEKAKACKLDGLNTITYEMIDQRIADLT